MIILTVSASSQNFTVIPRSYTATSVVIVEEGTEIDTTYTPTFSRVDYNDTVDTTGTYLKIADTFTLENDKYYTLSVLNGTDIIYKDRIFCTTQTIADYTINSGEYTQNSTDNDFIVI